METRKRTKHHCRFHVLARGLFYQFQKYSNRYGKQKVVKYVLCLRHIPLSSVFGVQLSRQRSRVRSQLGLYSIFSLLWNDLKLYILLFAKRCWHPITPTHQRSLFQGFIRNQRLFLYLSKIYDCIRPLSQDQHGVVNNHIMHSVDVKSRTRLMAGTMTRILYMQPTKNITLTLCSKSLPLCMDVLS